MVEGAVEVVRAFAGVGAFAFELFDSVRPANEVVRGGRGEGFCFFFVGRERGLVTGDGGLRNAGDYMGMYLIYAVGDWQGRRHM